MKTSFARLYDAEPKTVDIQKHQVMAWLKELALMDDEEFAMQGWSFEDSAVAMRLCCRLNGAGHTPESRLTSGR